MRVVRFVRSLLILVGLATLPACAAHDTAALSAAQTATPTPAAAVQQDTRGKVTTSRTVVVYFDNNSAEIRASAMQTLYGAFADLRGAQLKAVRVTGHTDGAGRNSYNQRLSERRAAAVADQLAKLGVHAESITVAGAGESGRKARHSRADRRVEIVIEQVEESVAQAPASPPAGSAAFDDLSAPHATPAMPRTLASAARVPLPHGDAPASGSPETLRSDGKQAIKRVLVRDGTSWLPPPAA